MPPSETARYIQSCGMPLKKYSLRETCILCFLFPHFTSSILCISEMEELDGSQIPGQFPGIIGDIVYKESPSNHAPREIHYLPSSTYTEMQPTAVILLMGISNISHKKSKLCTVLCCILEHKTLCKRCLR